MTQFHVWCAAEAHNRPATAGATVSNNSGGGGGGRAAASNKPVAETVNCPLCERNERSVVFQCGHSCCRDCSTSAVQSACHVCGTAILKRISLN